MLNNCFLITALDFSSGHPEEIRVLLGLYERKAEQTANVLKILEIRDGPKTSNLRILILEVSYGVYFNNEGVKC